MKITLIGMPGSGKSFVGKKLSERLGYSFVDIDKLLEEKYGMPLPQVLEKLGQEQFLREEADATFAQVLSAGNLVLSPGGSIIYSKEAMEHIKKNSLVLFLKVSLETLESRIGNIPRGIVGLHAHDLQQLFSERIPLYKKWAGAVIDGDREPNPIIEDILRAKDFV